MCNRRMKTKLRPAEEEEEKVSLRLVVGVAGLLLPKAPLKAAAEGGGCQRQQRRVVMVVRVVSSPAAKVEAGTPSRVRRDDEWNILNNISISRIQQYLATSSRRRRLWATTTANNITGCRSLRRHLLLTLHCLPPLCSATYNLPSPLDDDHHLLLLRPLIRVVNSVVDTDTHLHRRRRCHIIFFLSGSNKVSVRSSNSNNNKTTTTTMPFSVTTNFAVMKKKKKDGSIICLTTTLETCPSMASSFFLRRRLRI